jgi:hypothetical protein
MFKYRLALRLGMTVAELETRMSHDELVGWMAYSQIEPFGPEMQTYRAGLIASVIANVNRGKNQKPFTPQDFMPKTERQHRREISAEVKSIFAGFSK